MLKGLKIHLRTLEPTDADQILNWENDPENWRVSGTQVPFSRHLVEQYVNTAQDIFTSRQIRFMICANENGRPVGCVDLFDYEPIHQRVGVGILIDSAYRNTGIGKEALELLSDYGLNGLGVRNLYCSIMGDNLASRALFEKAGFVQVGYRKNWYSVKGFWMDEYLYQKALVE